MTRPPDRVLDDYLRNLNRRLRGIPAQRRKEIVDDVREHIGDALLESPSATEADVRNILDQLGDPDVIAGEARESLGLRRQRIGVLEVLAIVLLLVGGLIVPLVGWVVGVVLLWVSSAWTSRDKLLGTMIVPGGLALPVFLSLLAVGVESCQTVTQRGEIEFRSCVSQPLQSQVWAIAILVLLTVAPIAVAVYLARRARSTDARRPGAESAASGEATTPCPQ